MPRTSRADQNLYSLSNNVAELFSGTDHPVRSDLSYLDQPDALLPTTPQDWDAILKICDGTSALYRSGLKIAQGRENAVDLNNRAQNVALHGEFGFGGGTGDQVITVKGGCHGIKLWGVVYSRGRNASVVVGAWSDQCFDVSEDLDFAGLTADEPLTFVLARCRNVKLPPGAKVLFWKSLGYRVYWWAKWAAVKTGLLK